MIWRIQERRAEKIAQNLRVDFGNPKQRAHICELSNLDHRVDLTDFTVLAANFNQSGRFWTQGDFNYDGLVDTIDFNVMASNFGQAVAADSLSTMTVPEPSVISVFFIFVLPTLRGAGASCRSR